MLVVILKQKTIKAQKAVYFRLGFQNEQIIMQQLSTRIIFYGAKINCCALGCISLWWDRQAIAVTLCCNSGNLPTAEAQIIFILNQ